MPSKKSYAFALFLLFLTLIALLGVALVVYGSITWEGYIVPDWPTLFSQWEATFRV